MSFENGTKVPFAFWKHGNFQSFNYFWLFCEGESFAEPKNLGLWTTTLPAYSDKFQLRWPKKQIIGRQIS